MSVLAASCFGANAQDVIMTRDYSVIEAVVSEISDDYVTYKAFKNQEGPNIKLKTANVFKITFQNGSEQFFNEKGSMVETKEEATAKLLDTSYEGIAARNSSAELIRNGNILTFRDNGLTWALTSDMVSPEFWSRYRSASIMKDAGEYMWACGLGWMLGAALSYAIWQNKSIESFLIASACICGPVIVAGIPLDVVGSKRLNSLADEYNKQHSDRHASLTFGAQRYGVGIALRF